MHAMTNGLGVIVCGIALCTVGCFDNINAITELNRPPEAIALTEKPREADEERMLGARVEFAAPPAGERFTFTLNGAQSNDSDGTVEFYDWRSAVVIDQDCPEDDLPRPEPWDSKNPKVELPRGVHVFLLWVTDNDGAISRPSSVVIAVGEPLPPEGEEASVVLDSDAGVCPVEEVDEGSCMAAQPDNGISDGCRACTCAECPEEATDCDTDCWDLVNCVAAECAGDASDTTCIVANCNIANAAAATAIGPCATTCTDECAAM